MPCISRLRVLFNALSRPLASVEQAPYSLRWTRQLSRTSSPYSSETVPSVSVPSGLSKPIGLNETIEKPATTDLIQAFTPSSFVNHSLTTPLYASFRIHKNSFLVTVGDRVTLPFRLKDVQVGDFIRLTQIETLGSRRFTWKGDPFINDTRCVVKARVTEHTKEPMREKIRTTQRNRRVKHIKSKHHYTVLTISEIGIDGDVI